MPRKTKSATLPLEVETQKKIATFMANKGYEVRREVKTPVGKIDLLVTAHTVSSQVHKSTEQSEVPTMLNERSEVNIIECKRHHDVNSLKSAIGQLRAYSNYYPHAKLILCTEEKTPLSKPSIVLLNSNPDIRLVIV